jgi:hypothetical protein
MKFFLICVMLFATAEVSAAQGVVIQDSTGHRLNTWSARANNGAKFMGTWTAVPDTIEGRVRGTWTLIDTQGKILAAGTWSAAKSATEWTGFWRASVEQRAGEYGGTWSTKINRKSNAQLTDLFEQALSAVVDGNWWFGNYTGTWSIRAYK